MTKRHVEVLVIDDEPSITGALQAILEDNGYHVVIATTGHEGIRQARQQPFDVILTDLRLPDMTGIDLLNTLCQEKLGGPVILITAQETPAIFDKARSCGASSVLAKPFRPSDILDAITLLLTARDGAAVSAPPFSQQS